MDDSITLILPIRDRDVWRLEKLVRSLRSNGGDPRAILVDYGSSAPYAERYAETCRSLGILYERMETEGRPWNKCHAINRGVRLSESEYVCTADVDVYFVSNPFPDCARDSKRKVMYHIPAYWLGKEGDEKAAMPAGLGGPGGFQFVRRSAFEESGGYDERIVYWGQEDNDWPERLKALGYEQVWLPEPHRIYHQWHPSPESGSLRPVTASYSTMLCCVQNRADPIIDQAWGREVRKDDRPILSMMGNMDPLVVEFETNALSKYFAIVSLVDMRKKCAFQRIKLGSRRVRRPLSAMSGIAKSLLRPIGAMTGLDCTDKINSNFNYFYAALPALVSSGLRDYFVSRDYSEVFLLWET
jgi:hypothetical protein